jgi:hypothetical protein
MAHLRKSLYLSILSVLFLVTNSTTGFSNPGNGATPPEQAVGYWDEATMRSAKPIGLLMDPKTGLATLTVESTQTTTIGADWDGGGLAQTAVGKIFFTIGRSNYVCSGSIVNDEIVNISVVVTAAHCVNDAGRFATNWAFVPNYDAGNRSYWYASRLFVRSEFALQKQFNKTAVEHDWAFAVIPSGTFTKNRKKFTNPTTQLDSVFGSFNYISPGFTADGQTSTAFGYPAASPYNGNLLKYAQGLTKRDPIGYATWGMPSDLTGGASGGPWLSALSSDMGSVASVNSYKYTNDPNSMYGPKFNAKTDATFVFAKNNHSGTTDVVIK